MTVFFVVNWFVYKQSGATPILSSGNLVRSVTSFLRYSNRLIHLLMALKRKVCKNIFCWYLFACVAGIEQSVGYKIIFLSIQQDLDLYYQKQRSFQYQLFLMQCLFFSLHQNQNIFFWSSMVEVKISFLAYRWKNFPAWWVLCCSLFQKEGSLILRYSFLNHPNP